ncbi:MAG: OprO/OprP family phosphate-selective porin [Melioribacteraceae bacterium]|nr:OprO/OprP family phosphate-selective porin [Melioribacteraceae bacterium]
MKNSIFFVFILLLSLTNINAQEKDIKKEKDKIEFSGYGTGGYTFYNKNILNGYNQEAYYEGKVQLDIDFNKRIEGQLDFRGNSLDNAVKLKEFSIKLKIIDKFRLQFGNIKKPFGYEYLISEEDLISINRSYLQEAAAEIGYGGRSLSLMAYYKYNDKEPEFPFSYNFSVFKDNSLFTGAVARIIYHIGNYGIGATYEYENKGGENKTSANGFGFNGFYESHDLNAMTEIFYVQDPFESIRQRLMYRESNIYGFGAKIFTSYLFDYDYDFLKGLEPFLLSTIFIPNTDVSGNNVIQILTGINYYLHKDVRLRLNGDLRLTKNQFNIEHTADDSRIILELQMRY